MNMHSARMSFEQACADVERAGDAALSDGRRVQCARCALAQIDATALKLRAVRAALEIFIAESPQPVEALLPERPKWQWGPFLTGIVTTTVSIALVAWGLVAIDPPTWVLIPLVVLEAAGAFLCYGGAIAAGRGRR